MVKKEKNFEKIIEFLINVGKLKKMQRRGWELRGVKTPETIASHTFRTAIMAWVLGQKKKINTEKLLKIALIHDICEVYAGDTTPYDKILPKDKKKSKELLNKWPRFSKKEKERSFYEKYIKEKKSLTKITSTLPPSLKKEINSLWNDYEKGLTKEGRFMRQLDRLENLLQALEYWKKGEKFMIEPWWIQIKELIDDPILLDFIKALDEKFHKNNKKNKK